LFLPNRRKIGTVFYRFMLTTLRIKNLALVADLTLELRPGYSVITGETGAGKSILIGALNLVLGERADRTLIRSGSECCTVEAVFDLAGLRAPIAAFLDENGLEACVDHQLVLKRTFSLTGTNRQFINGSPATLNTLAALGQWLVDIHGPHDHQSLLHPARQLEILDAFGGLQPLRSQFTDALRRHAALQREKVALVGDERTFAQELDLLRFQVNEIKAAHLQPDEEPQLQQEFQRSSHAARLLQLSQTVVAVLGEDDNAVLQQAAIVGRTLQEVQKIDPAVAQLMMLHEQGVAAFQELQREMAGYADRLEIDPLRHQELEDRLNLIQGLQRKYGPTLAEIIAFGEQARRKMILLEQRDLELIRLDGELQEVRVELRRLGAELTAQRRKVGPKLSKAVAKQLADLGFRQSQFDASLASQTAADAPPAASGFDTVEFQFAPNPGEAARPLRAIASSGELARVMLALKTVLAAEDEIPVLVFDEVDANVGGETAHTVGEKMCQIGGQHQVLCITHLAPVAAPASAHFLVKKETHAGRTISTIELLDSNARVTELARMLGGQSDAARKHAEELMNRK
jgi:DNA repair protein RecN (Recombination protein N)